MSWVWNIVLSFSDEEFWEEDEEEPRETCEPLERINAWIPPRGAGEPRSSDVC